jgi:hypothetical protein
MSAEAQSLLIVGIAYVVGVGIWAWTMLVRSNMLLRELGERIDPKLWQSLGAPTSMKDVMNDPEKRWYRFVRNREYRIRCSTEVADLIDDFKRRQNGMLIIIGGAGALIIYRYWPYLLAGVSS